jgi:hypothetical protein
MNKRPPKSFGSVMKALGLSRKALLAIFALVFSLVTYFATKYLAPTAAEDVIYVIGFVDAVIVILINGIAKEDAAKWMALGGVAYFEDEKAG